MKKKIRRFRAFSAVSRERAARLVHGFATAAAPRVFRVQLACIWQARRFVIEKLTAIYGNVNEMTYDTENFTLTIPIGAEKKNHRARK